MEKKKKNIWILQNSKNLTKSYSCEAVCVCVFEREGEDINSLALTVFKASHWAFCLITDCICAEK